MGRQMKRRKGKGEGKGKGRSKRTGRASLVMNKRKILNGGEKRTKSGGPKERKARRAYQKASNHKGGFRPYQPDKGARKDFPKTKAEERIKRKR